MATVCCALSLNYIFMTTFRFILGLAVGAASSLSPMYLAEISPREVRATNVNKKCNFYRFRTTSSVYYECPFRQSMG
ncbi:MFS transporter (plasmid) [Lactiplantibacillus plantarum]|nr:MFS transporter [Lactiplantibacillus plantarum]WCE45046.1 MFS transporter [Lactiplantibacillus plantarum]